jgi:hypothetical protein
MNVRDSEFDALLATWLEDDEFVAPPSPVEVAVYFARTHPRRRDWLAFLRRDAMTTRATTGLRPVAIVIAVVALLALAAGGAVLIGSAPDATPTPIASPTPVAVEPLPTADARLERGHRYIGGLVALGSAVEGAGVEVPLDVAFTVGGGDWTVLYSTLVQSEPGQTCCWMLDGPGGSFQYHPVAHVFADACDTGSVVPIGPTVDDLVTALDEQANTEMSELIDVTLGGYPGKRFLMGPDSDLPESCPHDGPYAVLSFFPDLAGDPGFGITDFGSHESWRSKRTVYVIDVQGNRVVFTTRYRIGPAAQDVLASMEFSVR